MCGIVGMAGDLRLQDETTIKRMLLLDSIRGLDSTGLAAVRLGGLTTKVAKRASHCFNLFDTKSFSEVSNANASIAFIGHNRSATSGLVKDVNAHPFQIDHITGVHNGTLEDGDKTMLEKMLDEEYNVDSEALFAAIARFGVKEVIPKLKKGKDYFKGAWSLVWWDAKDKTLNFLRNAHRPMWYCYSEDFKQVFWASEHWMLDVCLQKNGTYKLFKKKSEKEEGKVYTFFSTAEDTLYTIDVTALKKGSKERPKFSATPLKGKEPEEAKTSLYPFVGKERSEQHGSGCGKDISQATRIQELRKKHQKKTNSSSDRDPQAIHLIGDVDSPYANYVQREEFIHFGQTSRDSGSPSCNWCHKEVPFGMPGITVFFRDNIFLCPKCSGVEEKTVIDQYAPASRFYVTRAMFNEAK